MPPAEADLHSIGGYRICHKISSGGMGVVYQGERLGEHGFKKKVAIKLLLPSLFARPEIKTLFIDEARLAARLNHPNICQIFDFGEDQGSYYLVMEYLEGLRVLDLLRFFSQRQQKLDQRLVARIIASAARGLHYAHEQRDDDGKPLQVVHRDISPDNIIITQNGIAKVVDFGIARWEDRITETRKSVVRGKASYMAPEQLERGDIDRRADVFSLAVVFFELLTGHPLFRRSTPMTSMEAILSAPIPAPSSLRPGMEPQMEAVLLQALQRDRNKRTPTAHELARGVEVAVQNLGGSARDEELALLVHQCTAQTPGPSPGRATALSVPERSSESSVRGLPPEHTTLPLGPAKLQNPRPDKTSSDLMQRDPLLFGFADHTQTDDAFQSCHDTTELSSVWRESGGHTDTEEIAQSTTLPMPPARPPRPWATYAVASLSLLSVAAVLWSLSGPSDAAPGRSAPPSSTAKAQGEVEQQARPQAFVPRPDAQQGAPSDATALVHRDHGSASTQDTRRQVRVKMKRRAPTLPPRTRPRDHRPAPDKAQASAADTAPQPRKVGWINVTASPAYGNVRIDGQVIDSTPLLRFELSAGAHEIELLAPDSSKSQGRRHVEIIAGQITKVRFQAQ